MFSFITNFLEPIVCTIYFIILVLQYRFKRNTLLYLLFFYYAGASILLTFGALKVGPTGGSNIWIYDLVSILASVLIGAYFYHLLQSPRKKRIVLLLIAIYLFYALARNVSLQGMRLFDSIGYSILSASVTIYVFMYFHQVLRNVNETSILKDFDFWLASGYLLYFAGSFIIFISYHYLTLKVLPTYTAQERATLTALWGLHNLLLFISALSLLTGYLWINFRRKSAS